MLRGGSLLLDRLLLGRSSGSGFSAIVLAHGLNNRGLLLRLNDSDDIRKSLLGAGLAIRVAAAHDLDLDTEHTLTEQDVTGGSVDELTSWLARVDHEAVSELHGLGAGSAKLAGDDNLATLGTALHDEAENAVAGTADGQTIQELVAQRLALGDSRETAVLNLGGIEGDGVLGELKALLDETGELADAAALLAKDLLGVGGANDDIGDSWSNADLDAGVALLSQLALEELVQLSVENAVGDELPLLGAADKKQTRQL